MLVVALALWRVSSLLARERGPFDVFERVRKALGFEHDDAHNISGWPDTYLPNLVACVWCLSLMLAIPLAVVFVLWPSVVVLMCLPFALSAVAILIDRVAKHG